MGSLTGLILCLLVAICPHLYLRMPGSEFAGSAVFGVKSAWVLGIGTFLCLSRLMEAWRGRALDLRTGLEKPLLLLILTSLLSLSLATYPEPLLVSYISLLAHLAIFYLLVDYWRQGGEKGGVVWSPVLWAFLSGVLMAVHVLFQSYGIDFADWEGGVPDWRGRLTAFMGGPDFVGGYLALVLPYGIWWATSGRRTSFAVRWVLLIPVVAALTVTFSMGAWSGLLGGFVLCLFFAPFRRKIRSFRGVAVIFVFVAVFGFYFLDNPWNGIGRSILREAAASPRWRTGYGARRFIWGVTAGMVRERPVLGIGFGNYDRVYHQYEGQYRAKIGTAYEHRFPPDVPQVHNEYYHHLAETGMVGFFALAWLLAAGVRRLRRVFRRLTPGEQGPWLAVLCGLTVGAVHGLQSYPLRIPSNAFLVVLFASYLFAPRIRGRGSGIGDRVDRVGRFVVAGGVVLFAATLYVGLAPVLSDLTLYKALSARPPEPVGIERAIAIYPWSPHAWYFKSRYHEAMGDKSEAIAAAKRTIALHGSVQFRQRIRDLYRGDLRQPVRGDRRDLLAALLEGRKTLELNPTYAPLCVEQAVLEKEVGYEEGARECSRRAGQLLSELRRRDDQRTFQEQMGEIEPLRKNASVVFQWVMEEMQTGGEGK